jgi:hypothetical protein
MSRIGAAPRAAVPATSARAETSRQNGAQSRGPKTSEGKARSAQNALKHGLRAQKYLVLPEEDAAEFEALEAALVEELAPVGAMQTVLARRVAIATWRLARADRLEVEQPRARAHSRRQRHALVRDAAALSRRGDGRVLARAQDAQALQAEQALDTDAALLMSPLRPASRPQLARHEQSNEPEPCPQHRLDALIPEPGCGLHEAPAIWQPNEPEPMPGNPPGAVERAGARTIKRTQPCRNEE